MAKSDLDASGEYFVLPPGIYSDFSIENAERMENCPCRMMNYIENTHLDASGEYNRPDIYHDNPIS